jgi:hypothetical protein
MERVNISLKYHHKFHESFSILHPEVIEDININLMRKEENNKVKAIYEDVGNNDNITMSPRSPRDNNSHLLMEAINNHIPEENNNNNINNNSLSTDGENRHKLAHPSILGSS